MKKLAALKATAWMLGLATITVLASVFLNGWDAAKLGVILIITVWGSVFVGWIAHGLWRDLYQHYEKSESE